MRVILAPLADADLTAIIDSFASFSRTAARGFVERLVFRCHMLEQNPELGERCSEFRPGLRRTTIQKIVVYYEVLESHIRIVRILHGYRDHGPLLESKE